MELYKLHTDTDLGNPVLVVALEGWVDAGLAAATAVTTLLESVETDLYASFATDELLDQRARRPIARITDGLVTELRWPEIKLLFGKDHQGRTVALLIGVEPDYHWRSFIDAVIELTTTIRARLVVGLGAFPAPVPHTRPVKLVATSSPGAADLANQVGFVHGSMDVAAGIYSALEAAYSDMGIPSLGLWARVPHYVANMPYPAASLTLLETLSSLTGLEIDVSSLRSAAEETSKRIDELISKSEDHLTMVRRLEEALDTLEEQSEEPTTSAGLGMDHIPSGDEIAAELERFLRGDGLGGGEDPTSV
ncbi:MAG: PAC2 family protein [Actinobacteria bacterium]|jgi:predicted ATP-grasp superfamily ATP-dependent carboligase|nr:PAC2 family protein [Actinomycetota bacterium]MCL6095068.1 PAC2 family protein [Actinomycetota bacterium]